MSVSTEYAAVRARMAMSIEQASSRIPDRMVREVFRWLGDQALDGLELRRELRELRTSGYKGVWKDGSAYREGHFVTHAGTIWHCTTGTTDRPGSSDAWQLMVKKNGR